ncbi:beta-ketoacyl-[acyl-carrier-protein] synthase family protein [Jidongwangia harbinensis]|uniref:beta-ketoacyl-[acyl-carrier-protein] synthase family protein n=1 Tax=Jidongwangia harbinensis TaxID=2878561 RepID=UPI001CD91829|nr:beta-ketoacyl-[acyl-carrier-protein] synthase family protein [Jidongwangia harbinensis]MCA2211384.1 beta-ketoacyl-[acyl-carrier-protein] synthase family protein [Jidongwangia harbinensis]
MAVQESVVVTGVGALSPLGGDAGALWDALMAGRSGVRRLDAGWAGQVPVSLAAPVTADLTDRLGRVRARSLDRVQQMALLAAGEAWSDAGAPLVPPERFAVVFGSGVGGVITLLNQHDVLRESGSRHISPHSITMFMPNGAATAISLALGARAAVHTPVSACASGAESIALGLDVIRTGRADVVVCGGAEAAIHPLPLAAFDAIRALSRYSGAPEDASRPFDRDRDGFVLGEGAGALVLESASHAAARGCPAYAELAGAGYSADAYHAVRPEPGGDGAARAMRAVLHDAGEDPAAVVHVNAHATATPLGDRAEAAALRAVLPAAGRVPVSATKSMTGHLLGAAGAVEAIVTVLSTCAGRAPASPTLRRLDDDIDLDVVRDGPRTLRRGLALSNSFGFGGHNVALAFRPAGPRGPERSLPNRY